MGFDLCRGGDGVYANVSQWGAILDLAREHGWKPMGTEAPSVEMMNPKDPSLYDNWNGSYFHNEGQWVGSKDAASLSAALSRAVDLGHPCSPTIHKIIELAKVDGFAIL
jgi:hypothetical protein